MAFVFLGCNSLLAQTPCLISFDSGNSTSGNASSLSVPITVSGSNRLLVAQVDVEANDGPSSVTGAAYGAAPMSQVIQTVRAGGGNGRQATFVLIAPPLGAGTLTVHLAGAKMMNIGVMDYNGVDQTVPVGAVSFTQDANSNSHSITLTTVADNSWIVSTFMWYPNNTSLSSLGTGQTQRWSQNGANGTLGDDKATLIAGPATMSYDLANSKPADIQAIEIRPCGLANTLTPTPSNTATNSPSFTPTATPTGTLTPTNTPLLTSTFTFIPTTTFTFSPTVTPTFSLTPIPALTFTPTVLLSATATPTSTPTFSPLTSPISVWPNPFTPQLSTNHLTTFDLPTGHGPGAIKILNIRRHSVRTIQFAEDATLQWDGRDDSGQLVHGGVYFYLLNVGKVIQRGTITVLR